MILLRQNRCKTLKPTVQNSTFHDHSTLLPKMAGDIHNLKSLHFWEVNQPDRMVMLYDENVELGVVCCTVVALAKISIDN